MLAARAKVFCLLILVTGLPVVVRSQDATQASAAQWKLVWNDEFDGAQIDRTKWDFDLGNGFYDYNTNAWISGWGNGELQCYTKEPENVAVSEGLLHLRALKESYQGCGYTSARLKTRKRDGSPLLATKYGRIEICSKLPTGQGVWPAVWMLPQDDKYGTWAASGEIDIVEARGQEPAKVAGTLHFGSRWPANAQASHEYQFAEGSIADFHFYALEWEPGVIRWYVDGQNYATQTFWWSSSKVANGQGAAPVNESELNPWPAPFDQPFYLLLNVAVGGQFPGNPDQTTKFPAEMLVDYVRIFERAGGYNQPASRGPGPLPFQP